MLVQVDAYVQAFATSLICDNLTGSVNALVLSSSSSSCLSMSTSLKSGIPSMGL